MLPPEQFERMQRQTAALPVHPFWIALALGLIAGITINAVAGFGEELGWRGFLQKEFGFMGFWKSSLLIGVPGLAGFIVLAIINLVIFAYERLVCRVGSAHQLPGRVLPAYFPSQAFFLLKIAAI